MANPAQAVKILHAYTEWHRTNTAPREHSAEHADHAEPEPADPTPQRFDPTQAADLLDDTKLLPAVWLYVHLATGTAASGNAARVEGSDPVTAQWVRKHLGERCRFKITPVLDPLAQVPVDAYEIPHRHRHAVHMLTPADTFPFASNTTRDMQVDRNIAWTAEQAAAGEKLSRIGNYGPMVGLHHRIKTHGGWAVRQPFPGIYLWRDPHGAMYLVDHTGTRRLPRPRTAPATGSVLEARVARLARAS